MTADCNKLTHLFLLAGTGAPKRSVLSGPFDGKGLDVHMQGVTDLTLTDLLPALAERATGLAITGEHRPLCRLALYLKGPAVAMAQTKHRHV